MGYSWHLFIRKGNDDMSMVVTSANGNEVELPQRLVQLLRELGIENNETDTQLVINILKQSRMNVISLGDTSLYTKINEAIDEISTWNDEVVHVEI